MTEPPPATSAHLRPAVTRLAIGVAVGVFGITFGVLAVSAGLTAWQAQAMSLLVFTGAVQFAAVGVIDSGGTPAAALGSAAPAGRPQRHVRPGPQHRPSAAAGCGACWPPSW